MQTLTDDARHNLKCFAKAYEANQGRSVLDRSRRRAEAPDFGRMASYEKGTAPLVHAGLLTLSNTLTHAGLMAAGFESVRGRYRRPRVTA